MQKYIPTFFTAERSGEQWAGMREDSEHGEYYAASEVDDRIAELEAHCDDVEQASMQANARIAELDKVLREAHYFASEDFQFAKKDYNALTVDDVCATHRYLDYWKALNKALGL